MRDCRRGGSPPQVRGKPRKPASKAVITGITPAGAGKTEEKSRKIVQNKDHPRRCGENCHPLSRRNTASGSPPQVRGKLEIRLGKRMGRGITPAGAGKTSVPRSACLCRRDHPRRCGENLRLPPDDAAKAGSPPQVRGKPSPHQVCRTGWRITPAGAGKTKSYVPFLQLTKDHPRRCGENLAMYPLQPGEVGSPPQVRGKLGILVTSEICSRITPAGAGKTERVSPFKHEQEDHPRRCGENTGLSPAEASWAGSPPQVRGKPLVPQMQYSPPGITPAGAGKTFTKAR